MIGPNAIDVIYIQFGLGLYCIKVFVDTQRIYERVKKGHRDVISHALTMFLNILHLFIRIVVIVARIMAEQEKQKREAQRRRR